MKLRSVILAAAAALMVSQSASALSCMRPDLGETMEKAKASDKLYYVLVGKFRYDANRPVKPKTPKNQFEGHPPEITPAWFEGYGLSNDSRTDAPLVSFPVDIEVSCAGPWCGGLPSSETTQIAFVEARDGAAPILRVSACPMHVFRTEAGDGKVEKLRACFDNKCESERPDYY